MPPEYELIQNKSELDSILPLLASAGRIAVDTEADSLHHYHEKVCLIQISAAGRHFVVDPLGALDLAPLLEQFSRLELIFHGADYDLRMLRLSYGFEPGAPVFDTMLAAQLLNFERFGLAALVEHFFQVVLPKGGQKWDWSRRPLSEKYLEYAANDTRYLEDLARRLEADLAEKGRLDWHREWCAGVVESSALIRERDPETEWRVKGYAQMEPAGLAILRELWSWREAQAAAVDYPTYKILNNGQLIEVALWLAEHPEEAVEKCADLPRSCSGARLPSLREAVRAARALPPSKLPSKRVKSGRCIPRRREDDALMDKLREARDLLAKDLELNPSLLAPKAALMSLSTRRPRDIEGIREAGGLMRWQAELLGPLWLPLVEAPQAVP
jgi:ribonuclease D